MRRYALLFLGALSFSLACDPQHLLGGKEGGGDLTTTNTQAAPSYPSPGTCTTDNSDPNYTCQTCTSAGGGVITITCTPKVVKTFSFWW